MENLEELDRKEIQETREILDLHIPARQELVLRDFKDFPAIRAILEQQEILVNNYTPRTIKTCRSVFFTITPVLLGVFFLSARRYASEVLAVIVCPSVCPSVRLTQRWLNLRSNKQRLR